MSDTGSPVDPGHDAAFGRIKDLARHSAVYGVFDFLGRAGAIVLVPMYTRVLGPADFADLELYLVSQILLVLVAGMGFHSAMTRYYVQASTFEEKRAVFRTALTAVLVGVSVLLGLLWPWMPAIARWGFGPGEDPRLGVLLLATVAVEILGLMFLTLFRAQERAARYSVVNLSRLLVALGVNIWLVADLGWGVRGVLTGNLAGAALALVVGAALSGNHLGLRIDGNRMRMLAAFGVPLAAGGLAMFALNNGDRYLLRAFAPGELGPYALACKIAVLMSMAVNAFALAWPPVLFRVAPTPEAPQILSRIPTYFVAAYLPGALLLAALSPELVALGGTREFASAVPAVGLVAAAHLFNGLFTIFSMGAVLTDRTRIIPLCVAAAVAVNLLLNAVLIGPLGGLGAGWARFGAFLFLAALAYPLNQARYRVPLEWGKVGRMAGLAAGLAVAVTLLIGEPSPAGAAFRASVVLLGYPAGLAALRVLDAEERYRIRRLLRRGRG